MLRVIDAHVHLGIVSPNDDCEKFLIKTGYDRSVSPKDVIIQDDDIEIEKIILVPSLPCGNNFFTDSFYDQRNWFKGYEETFFQYGTINPRSDKNVIEELSTQYSLGIVGIKLHPVHHFFKANDYRPEEGGLSNLEKVYQFAEDYNLPVLIHTGTSITPNGRNKYADPIYIDDPAKDFGINIILAHAGRPLWTETAFFMAKHFRNVFLEISSIPQKHIKEYLPRLGDIKEKVIYGSDYPNYLGENLLMDAKKTISVLDYDIDIMKNNFLRIANIKL